MLRPRGPVLLLCCELLLLRSGDEQPAHHCLWAEHEGTCGCQADPGGQASNKGIALLQYHPAAVCCQLLYTQFASAGGPLLNKLSMGPLATGG